MIAMAAIAIFVLWGVYSFRYAMHPVNEILPPLDGQLSGLSAIPAKTIQLFARFHLLPESYLYGLVDVQHVGVETPSYIFGKVYAHGQWFYFPVASLAQVDSRHARSVGRWHSTPSLPGASADHARSSSWPSRPSSTSPSPWHRPLNIGVRHVLPIFPFVFALAAGGAWGLMEQKTSMALPGSRASALARESIPSVCSPTTCPTPTYSGGGLRKVAPLPHLIQQVDWAQQLKWTKQYLDANNIHECWFAYFAAPFLLPSDYGIPCKLLPTLDTTGRRSTSTFRP